MSTCSSVITVAAAALLVASKYEEIFPSQLKWTNS
jgi:hypothetical protein